MSKNKHGVMLTGMRKICLKLPQVEEFEEGGVPSFRATGQPFVRLGENVQPLGPTVSFKPAPNMETMSEDGRFETEKSGWMTLALHDSDWEELQELAEESYRSVATEAMLEELEAQKPALDLGAALT